MNIPMDFILPLANRNVPNIIKEKAKEEANEYLNELETNGNDDQLLEECADVLITMFQVLDHKGLLESLPKRVLEKSRKALIKHFPEVVI